jgi:hypothetical protein
MDKDINMTQFWLIPMGIYMVWMFFYFIINFVISAKKIREKNYDNMYLYYEKKPWANKLLNRKGFLSGPLLFLTIHFSFFSLCHFYAILCFKYYYFCTLSICFGLSWSIWNSSCFYMDYFSKKYEASLQRLDQVQ